MLFLPNNRSHPPIYFIHKYANTYIKQKQKIHTYYTQAKKHIQLGK